LVFLFCSFEERFYTHMKKTPQKILESARVLFNTKGVNNVRLQDIAKHTDISPGNLSYHYSTKKDLMSAVLVMLQEATKDMRATNMHSLESEDYLGVVKNYLRFQIGHRFFYRDILDIINLVPEGKQVYEQLMNQVISFTKNGIYLAVGKGLMKPEPHDESFHFFAKNIWGILNSWLIEREVLGTKKVGMDEIMLAIWEYHYPYLTEKGMTLYENIKKQIPKLVKMEMAND